jgi:hypothetical protein
MNAITTLPVQAARCRALKMADRLQAGTVWINT